MALNRASRAYARRLMTMPPIVARSTATSSWSSCRVLGKSAGTRLYSSYPTPEGAPAAAKAPSQKKVTLLGLQNLYNSNTPITSITAHDYPSAVVAEKAGVDMILVGDSLAMVALGYNNTNMLSLDEMLYHCRAVARGAKRPLLVADLTFGSYEISPEQALESSIRLVKEGNMEAVKLEGGREMVPTIKKITNAGIPVLGHIGLTPQRSTSLSGFRVQGKSIEDAQALIEDAQALQEAGCFAIVLEAVPDALGRIITEKLQVPTIGIGAGADCSGQILVQLDMLGQFDKFTPRFVKKYAQNYETNVAALQEYVSDVRARAFPAEEHVYKMNGDILAKLQTSLGSSPDQGAEEASDDARK
ncbi:ketopantoate hydroxymethyltransferase-domain-containing protein [Myxozyma melibiosi]|uniref:3-methyl-2-oxobutanoate hydroxymethyltransferase n=1 Tax=Myxozyma melibiosi TaxID=54550 RepID=A0ABR1F466_9ASCO